MAVRGRGTRRGSRPRYAARDWAPYDGALARRGDIAVRVSPGAVAGWRGPRGKRTFPDAAIAAALAVRAACGPALRQAGGPVASVFAPLGVALPALDHTTPSRRGRALRLDRRADLGGAGAEPHGRDRHAAGAARGLSGAPMSRGAPSHAPMHQSPLPGYPAPRRRAAARSTRDSSSAA
jgi:hypothetical protein